jgi:hypothetical protein
MLPATLSTVDILLIAAQWLQAAGKPDPGLVEMAVELMGLPEDPLELPDERRRPLG